MQSEETCALHWYQCCTGTVLHWYGISLVRFCTGTILHWYGFALVRCFTGTVLHWYSFALVSMLHWFGFALVRCCTGKHSSKMHLPEISSSHSFYLLTSISMVPSNLWNRTFLIFELVWLLSFKHRCIKSTDIKSWKLTEVNRELGSGVIYTSNILYLLFLWYLICFFLSIFCPSYICYFLFSRSDLLTFAQQTPASLCLETYIRKPNCINSKYLLLIFMMKDVTPSF